MITQRNSSVPRNIPKISVGGVWGIGALCIAILVVIPILSVVYLAFFPTENIWPHLLSTTLPRYVGTTLTLMMSVGVGTVVL